jgi:uncharacterized protein (TIGR02246 family)
MELTKQKVADVLDVYMDAWRMQDPSAILLAFTEDASYHERVLGEPMVGHDAIRRYWQQKVVGEQANIEVELLAVYLDGHTAIAEWEAIFDDRPKLVRKKMREIAVLEFVHDGEQWRIESLREYWASKEIGTLKL